MSNIYGAENQMLGGFGGWGSGSGMGSGFGAGLVGGILGGALFGGNGGLFGNRGNNGCCATPVYDVCGDKGHCGHDGHHTEEVILDDAHYNSVITAIGGVKDGITNLGYNIGDKFAATNYAIGQVGYQAAINTKDIIHDIDMTSCKTNGNIDKSICATNANIAQTKFELSKQISDCCCETKQAIACSTQTILNKLAADKEQELLARLCKCEKENDMFRFNGIVSANIANLRATTVGSNFNTGTQSTAVSSNSGQQIGA